MKNPPPPSYTESVKELTNSIKWSLQGLLWVFVNLMSYAILTLGTVASSLLLCSLLGVPPHLHAWCALGGALVGAFLGLSFTFAIAPLHLKTLLRATAFPAGPKLDLIKECKQAAGIDQLTICYFESAAMGLSSALVAGFTNGRSIFRPVLFLSRELLQRLTQEELKAVILHELSHLSLQHLKKRVVYSFLLFLGTSSLAVVLTTVSYLFLSRETAASLSATILSLVIAVPFLFILRKSKMQEYEADRYSVTA